MKEKSCSRCRVTKPIEMFSPTAKSASGYASWCRTCVSQGNSHRSPENRKRGLQVVIEAGGNVCSGCGHSYHHAVYGIAHKDSARCGISISNTISKSEKEIRKQMKDYNLVCANCIRIAEYEKRLLGEDDGLTAKIVLKMRVAAAEGKALKTVAREFGVKYSTAYQAIKGHTWGWVE